MTHHHVSPLRARVLTALATICVVASVSFAPMAAAEGSEPPAGGIEFGIASAPTLADVPQISGTLKVGATLTATTGLWTGTAPITFTYQWQRCNGAGAGSCSNLADETGPTYTLVAADENRRIRVLVTASNAEGSVTAPSPIIGPVRAGAPPTNTSAPSISGIAEVGATLTADPGVWEQADRVSIQWLSCTNDSHPAACTDLTGATGTSYTVTVADANRHLRVRVVADNVHGATTTHSPATSMVPAVTPPNPDTPAEISGQLQVHGTLHVFAGVWSGTPPFTATYQWQRCTNASPASCVDIDGATGHEYLVTLGDEHMYLRAVVSVSNVAGSATVSVMTDEPVPAAVAPTLVEPPVIVGDAKVGEELHSSHGTWEGSTPMSFTIRWQRCTAPDVDCTDIDGATNASYTVTVDDFGFHLRTAATAVNSFGTATGLSASTAQTHADAPTSTGGAPEVSGVLQSGRTLGASTDGVTFDGVGTITQTVLWARCTSGDVTDCTLIDGADGPAYELTDNDVGAWIAVAVVAGNLGGETTVLSDPVGPVLAAAGIAAGPVTAGGQVTVSGSGYLPGTEITFTLYPGEVPSGFELLSTSTLGSTPFSTAAGGTVLGTTAAGADGTFSVTFTLPSTLAPGPYHIAASGVDVEGLDLVQYASVMLAADPVTDGDEHGTPTAPGNGPQGHDPSGRDDHGGPDGRRGPESRGDLAHTGTDAGTLSALGGVLLVAGLVLVGARPRRTPLPVR